MTGLETLPVEILQLIFGYTLPEPLPILSHAALEPSPPSCLGSSTAAASAPCSWTTFPTRSAYLRTYALLSKTWSDWARREMARHVVLRTADQLRLFLRQRPRPYSTETLRIGGVERNGRLLDASRLGEVVDRVRWVRQVWLVQVENVDLRDLRNLQDLRALICVSVSVSFSSASAQQPVPSAPPCFPHLHTLVLHQIHVSPFIRTILYESHSFDQLRVLAFDSAEVVEQIFDSDPEGMPRLVAMRPGHDLQFEYYTALDAVQDESPREDEDGEYDRSERRRTGLISLSASSNFLGCFEHYAPWLPDSIRRLSLDLSGGPEATSLPPGTRTWLDPGVDAFVTAANRAASARRARAAVVQLGQGDDGDDDEVDTTAFDADLFLEQLDEIVLPADWFRLDPASSTAVQGQAALDRAEMPDEVFACFERLRTEHGVRLVRPPRSVVRLEVDGADEMAPQDSLVPWRFLVEAQETLAAVPV
ncbi:hypothetical protein BMF94_0329 [Rhodotorula taiwanensis]|uniref:Uncharacterized protein n=1 Tax=Rhodotorula taiwanensis TaxID=741276 RepID=A0A2S5BIZ5_9BASI|nr:hypothetical protein BMF94_0329 [Rhodotorula taiwanensis]